MTLQEEIQRRALLQDQAAQILRDEAKALEERAQRHDAKAKKLREVLAWVV